MKLDYEQTKKKYLEVAMIKVKKEIYEEVIERDNYTCRLQDSTCEGWLELHHIVYRSEDKSKINDVNNCIMLCKKHHNEVHSNKHYWQPILKEMITNDTKRKNN